MRACLRTISLVMLGLLWIGLPARAMAREVQICVQDEHGLPIVGARIQLSDNSRVTMSGVSGCATLDADTGSVEITKEGFNRVSRPLTSESHLVVVMQVAGSVESIEVTA